jgi:hypothetical protein
VGEALNHSVSVVFRDDEPQPQGFANTLRSCWYSYEIAAA